MIIPYRTRSLIRRCAITLLALAVAAALIWALWFLWLGRFVVYTRDGGAVLNFDQTLQFQPGQVATPPKKEPVDIYFNEGENTINTSTELTQMTGYYIDTEALADGVDAIRAQLQLLPADTPVMLDVKSIYGNFYYSSRVSDKRASNIDPTAIDELIAYMSSKNLYMIARLPALRDYHYGLHHVPDGLPTKGGYLWMDDDYCYWLNPSSQGTITYLRDIISELKGLGFDEVVLQDFYFPDTSEIVFNADKTQALTDAAKTLYDTCSDKSFAVSFVKQAGEFSLPQGRCRLYLEGVAAGSAASIAQQSGLEDPSVYLVFLTEVHDTRFDAYSVLRPISGAH